MNDGQTLSYSIGEEQYSYGVLLVDGWTMLQLILLQSLYTQMQ